MHIKKCKFSFIKKGSLKILKLMKKEVEKAFLKVGNQFSMKNNLEAI